MGRGGCGQGKKIVKNMLGSFKSKFRETSKYKIFKFSLFFMKFCQVHTGVGAVGCGWGKKNVKNMLGSLNSKFRKMSKNQIVKFSLFYEMLSSPHI